MAAQPENVPTLLPKRRYPRTRVVWPATLRTGVGTFDCLVLDLSANGAKIQFSSKPEKIEGLVMLAIPRLPGFNATVAWVHPDHGLEMGLTFDDPPGEVAALLASVLPNSSAATFETADVNEGVASENVGAADDDPDDGGANHGDTAPDEPGADQETAAPDDAAVDR